MNTLFMAPQPFYQERGTPIAVDRILRVLSERGDRVDLVTWHEGRDMAYNRVTIHRIPNLPIRNIRPGFSLAKIICDIFMFFTVLRLASRRQYHLVHAVEEAVFIALLLKVFFKIPYVYDMDSSLAQQLIERHPWLTLLAPVLKFFEGLAVRNAKAVIPVCDALAMGIRRHEPKKVVVLQDISLLDNSQPRIPEDLRTHLSLQGQLLMYVGNLEPYQGIDLLVQSFALALKQTDQAGLVADLVVIGGEAQDIAKYQEQCRWLGIAHRVHFMGPRPIEHLAAYLAQADILVSPRIKGNNTPMKIYSYLDSGKPLLATDLPTHTQVLDHQVAVLARPVAQQFATGMVRLIEDATLRKQIGTAGQQLIQEKFTYTAFQKRVNGLFDWLKTEVETTPHTPARTSPSRSHWGRV